MMALIKNKIKKDLNVVANSHNHVWWYYLYSALFVFVFHINLCFVVIQTLGFFVGGGSVWPEAIQAIMSLNRAGFRSPQAFS